MTVTLVRPPIEYGIHYVYGFGNALGLCRLKFLAIDPQQESPYMFLPRIRYLNYYAVLRLLICSLSRHRPEEARVRHLETHGALNSRSIQGISQFWLVIQSVQLQKSSIICFLSDKSFSYRIKVTF